jgi:hypothetical protein
VRTKLSATKTEARLNEHANIVIGTEAQRSLMNMSSDCTGRLRINKCSSVAENISTDYRNRSNEIEERKINRTFSFTLKCNFDVLAQHYYLRVQLKNVREIHKSQVQMKLRNEKSIEHSHLR